MRLTALTIASQILIWTSALAPQFARAGECRDKKTDVEAIRSQRFSFIGTFNSIDGSKTIFNVRENFGDTLPKTVRFDTWKLQAIDPILIDDRFKGNWNLFTTDRPISDQGDLSLTECSLIKSDISGDALLPWLRENAPNLKVETRRIMEGEVDVEARRCWFIHGESYNIIFTGNEPQCPRGWYLNVEIARVSAPKFPADRHTLKTIYAKGRDEAAFLACARSVSKHNSKSEYHIECGYGPDEGTIRGYLKCRNSVFEISVRDDHFRYPSKTTTKMNLNALPDTTYRTLFKNFRCTNI